MTADNVQLGLEVLARDLKLTNVLWVDPNGKGYTAIQVALDACSGGETVIVVPGTYNESLTFRVNNVTVRGLGYPALTTITQADTIVINFGACTGCAVYNVTVSLTAPTQDRHMITGSGVLNVKFCHLALTCTASFNGQQPCAAYTTGTIRISRSSTAYTHSGNTNALADVKAVFHTAAGGLIIIRRSRVTVDNSGTALSTTMVVDNADGSSAVYNCDITLTDSGATLVVGHGYVGGTGTQEIAYTLVHVNATDAGGNDAYGSYVTGGTVAIRSMFSHIHCVTTAGLAYSFLQAGGATVVSQFDDIIAADGYTGNLVMINSPADGSFAAGVSARATGPYAYAQGDFSHAEGASSFVTGGLSHAVCYGTHAHGNYSLATLLNQYAHATGSFPFENTEGAAQFTRYLLRGNTTDAAAHELIDPEQFVLVDETTYFFRIMVCGRSDVGDEAMQSHHETVVERHGGNAAVLNDQVIGAEYQTDGAWVVAINVDNAAATKYLTVTVTGNNEDIRWVALIEAVEIIHSN